MSGTSSGASLQVREHPIIFSGPMVLAILEDRKTQTRRLVNPIPPEDTWVCGPVDSQCLAGFPDGQIGRKAIRCPYGSPGDHLWVRENAWIAPPNFGDEPNDPFANCTDDQGRKRVVGYSASMDNDSVRCAKDFGVKQSPSIHMPRWACRLVLEITGVRVQRLQDIGEEDALADGGWTYGKCPIHKNPEESYHLLWDSINAKRAPWAQNPWVWVLEFKPVDLGGRK